ncbi:MAG: DUF4178 domain-containing protein [Microcoleus vaginatus WJT46-NPBG5]|jgi:hypothetical protein|nr:DUF4178 domain-containing protein [Microcoleus vaginatus WJT46-NPBG5]
MVSVSIQDQLEQLRAGDRVKCHGLQWQITDYSTYQDPNGYETAEWLLQSGGGTEYYLLREVDPQNPETLVHWYLASEIPHPALFQPNSEDNVLPNLWLDMQAQKTPYPELRCFGKNYYFESQTQGSYEGDEENTSRITWDYWDRSHQWNLAIEAWPDRELHIYTSKVVKPEEFSEIEKGVFTPTQTQDSRSISVAQVVAASLFLVVGLYLLIFG